MIKIVIMEPGKWAKEKKVEPSIQVLRELVGGSFNVHRPRSNGIAIVARDIPDGRVIRANRQAVGVNRVRGGIFHGTIVAIGIERDRKTFRSLTKSEVRSVMRDYGRPFFPDYPQYGLEPGEELVIKSRHKLHPDQEGEPGRLVVIREYPYHIHLMAYVRHEEGAELNHYPVCINKADLISTDVDNPLRVVRRRTGQELKEVLE